MNNIFLELPKSIIDSKNPEIIFQEVERYFQNQSNLNKNFNSEKKLIEKLKTEKLQFTIERREIFQQICNANSQFTVEDIYFRILNKMHISRTTVQTSISLFESFGIIKKLNPENKRFSTNYYILQ